MKKIIGAAVAVALVAAGCGGDDGALDDASVGVIDDQPQFVMTNLDRYPNIAVRCFGTLLILTTTRSYGDAVNIVTQEEQGDRPLCVDGEVVDWLADTFRGELPSQSEEDE